MKFIFTALFSFLLATSAMAECSSGSVSDFNQYVESKGYTIYTLAPIDVAKVSALMQLPADGMSFTILDRKKGTVGIVLFYKGCIVPGSMIVISIDSFTEILKNAGVDEDKIAELRNA